MSGRGTSARHACRHVCTVHARVLAHTLTSPHLPAGTVLHAGRPSLSRPTRMAAAEVAPGAGRPRYRYRQTCWQHSTHTDKTSTQDARGGAQTATPEERSSRDQLLPRLHARQHCIKSRTLRIEGPCRECSVLESSCWCALQCWYRRSILQWEHNSS